MYFSCCFSNAVVGFSTVKYVLNEWYGGLSWQLWHVALKIKLWKVKLPFSSYISFSSFGFFKFQISAHLAKPALSLQTNVWTFVHGHGKFALTCCCFLFQLAAWQEFQEPSKQKTSFLRSLLILLKNTVNLRIGSCLACVYRVMDARGKFGEHSRS